MALLDCRIKHMSSLSPEPMGGARSILHIGELVAVGEFQEAREHSAVEVDRLRAAERCLAAQDEVFKSDRYGADIHSRQVQTKKLYQSDRITVATRSRPSSRYSSGRPMLIRR